MSVRARRPVAAQIRASSRRAKVLFYLVFTLALGVALRYFVVQVRDGKMLADRAYQQRLTTTLFAAQRGTIYDRDGAALVRSLPTQSVYATPADVGNRARTARMLAPVLGDRSPAGLEAALRTKAAYVLLDHKTSRERADRIAALRLPGISVVAEETGVRFAPSGRLASSVLGFTGFDEDGLDGIEFAFDKLLQGKPGRMALESDEFGRAIPFAVPHVVVAAKPGYSLVLTLDSFLQYDTEQILRETVAKWHAESGSAVVMDPWTGEILALANAPDFDLRNYAHFSPDARRDRAVADAYEPGSTFKLITAAAALDSGKVTTRDRFPARDALQIGGSTIHNAEDGFLAGTGGSENLEDIVTYSHNVGAAEVGLRIGRRTMYDTMLRFGFGDALQSGLPGENPGIVPRLETWSVTSLPTMAFGHGIATTPLAMARAYCAIANGGLLLRPRILAAILDPSGRVVYRYGREVERRAIAPQTAATLRRFLRSVVLRGTGKGAAEVPGYETAGKTGTAQVAENGVYAPGAYVASFIGLIPAARPRFVVLVKIAKPRGAIYGGVVAAPAFARIARLAMMHAGVLPVYPQPPARLVHRTHPSKPRL